MKLRLTPFAGARYAAVIAQILLLQGICILAAGQSQPFNFVASPMLSQSSRVSSNLSQFTGRPGFSVPIYSYKNAASTLTLNVSLDYTGGGLNILQNPSDIGAGWTLNAGGSVFRTINGLPDDRPQATPPTLGWFYGGAYIPTSPCCINYQLPGQYDDPINKTSHDSEEDDYYFDFNGRQGRLLIPQDILTGGTTPIATIPQSTVRTTVTAGGSVPANVTTAISSFTMTDEKGIQYTFSAMEAMQRKVPSLTSDGNSNYHYTYAFQQEYFGTAWKLTKMFDPNTQDEIDFLYTQYNVSYKVPDYVSTYTDFTNTSKPSNIYDDGQDLYKGYAERLYQIRFKNGDMIQFVYDTKPRADFVTDNALISIAVSNSNFTHGMIYNLNQSYLSEQTLGASSYQVIEQPYNNVTAGSQDNLGMWLFLKSVTQQAEDGSGNSLPVASFGYYRNTGNETSPSVPTRFYVGTGWCNLWGNATWGTQGMFGALDTVYNVNGGYSLYTYGYNDYTNSSGTTGTPGGLRVQSITQSDGTNHANDLVTTYTYQTAAGASSGFITTLPPWNYENGLENPNGTFDTYWVQMQTNTGIVPASTIQGSPVGYSRVVESVGGNGWTEHLFTSLADYPALYTTLPYPFPNMPQLADWAYGLPKQTNIFDKNGRFLRTVQNTYNVVITPMSADKYRSMKMAYQNEVPAYVFGSQTCATTASFYNFQYQLYYPTNGIAQLTKMTTTDYPVNGGTITSTVAYTYDPNYFVMTSSATTDSKGDSITTYPFYLFQSTNTSAPAYQLANSTNLLTSPYGSLTVLTHPDGTKYITAYSKMLYAVFNGMVKPQYAQTSKLAAPVSLTTPPATYTPDQSYGAATTALSTDVSFDAYDANGSLIQATNPLQYQVKCMLWDPSVHQQVAQANVAVGAIDYTSFENNQTGGWTVSSGSTFIIGGITGFTAFNGTLTKTITVPATYTLTLWCLVGTTATVNGAAGTVLLTRNNYQLETWTLTRPSTISVTGTNIDELRLFPQGAQMSTATYSPYTGITSTCDVNNRVSYYDYDTYGRLTDIRDQDGNVIRTFAFHYKGH